MRRFIVRSIVAVVVLAALGAGIFFGSLWLMMLKFNPAPPPTDYPKPKSALEAQRQDIDYFGKLAAMDKSYSPEARAQAEREISALAARQDVLSRPILRVAFMRVLALADNGHTRMVAEETHPGKLLPIGTAFFSDGLYIMSARPNYTSLLGARVVAIDHMPIDQVFARLDPLRGGIPSWKRYNAVAAIVQQDILYGAGIAKDPDHALFTVERNGATRDVTIDAFTPKPSAPPVKWTRWLEPAAVPGLKDWQLLQPASIPDTLKDGATTFRRERIAGSCAMLIELKANVDTGSEKIADFINATTADMKANPPCALILDMRFNTGGDYTNTSAFAAELPKLITPSGRIFELTGPSTFSAAITTTAFVKQAGGDRVTILGEPVGDRMPFFAEGNRGCTPNTHLCVYYQTGKHDYEHPCTDPNVCYWLNWFYPVRVKTLDPDETIAMSFAEWKSGHDPVYERAVELARK
jgi:hypothetical protein